MIDEAVGLKVVFFYIDGSRHSRRAKELVESTPGLDVTLREWQEFYRGYGYDRDNVLPQQLPALIVRGLNECFEGLDSIEGFLNCYRSLVEQFPPVLQDGKTGELAIGLDKIKEYLERRKEQSD